MYAVYGYAATMRGESALSVFVCVDTCMYVYVYIHTVCTTEPNAYAVYRYAATMRGVSARACVCVDACVCLFVHTCV